jgi:GTPase SAR1 family protein
LSVKDWISRLALNLEQVSTDANSNFLRLISPMTKTELKACQDAKEAIARCAEEKSPSLLLAPLHHGWNTGELMLEGSLSGPLPALPESLFSLTHLENLFIWGATISSLPEKLRQLPNLRQLALSDTKIARLPSWFNEMKSIRSFHFSDNPLAQDESDIHLPPNLERLTLRDSGIGILPTSILNQGNLKSLNLSHNPLREISSDIGLFRKLEYLNLTECNLKKLPVTLLELAELGTLKHLVLHGNPALELPDAVLGPTPSEIHIDGAKPSRPLDILIAYFDKQKAKDSRRARPFREARVVLVGDGLAGKSSVANWLVHGQKADTKKRQQTLGVDILEWKIPNIPGKGELVARVWDFGGQELMHETHQKLFLGEEAVYILVVNRGGEDPVTKIRYWMKLIRAQAQKARVLVALNHCDDKACHLSERDLPAECCDNFPEKALFPTSCKTGWGLTSLKKALFKELSALREPWLPWAPEYFAVKEKMAALKKEGRPHVTLDYYSEVCATAGLKEEGGRNALLACLDHAGLLVRILNFEDEDRALLEPEWLTSGLYQILNHKELANSKGLLDTKNLGKWLDPQKYPAADRAWLLRVMTAHELAFESSGDWFVPPLLQQSPDKDAEAALQSLSPPRPALRLICRYRETLPVGAIGRMIAKSHHRSPRRLWWRDGIVLEDVAGSGCEAAIQAHWDEVRGGQGEVSLTVAGSGNGPVRLMAVLRENLEEIHRSYRELDLEWQVPHPDFPDAPPIPLTELEAAEREGLLKYKRHMGCHGFKEIDVSRLLGPLAQAVPSRSTSRMGSIASDSDLDEDVAPPKPPYVFLSYMGEDTETIRDLRDALQGAGLSVWWDKVHIPGGNAWRMFIKNAVLKANALISCWSNSVEERNRTVAKYEVETAVPKHLDMLNGHAFIFPVRLEECEIPLIEVGNNRLEDLQTRDLFGAKGANDLKKLVADLKRAMSRK